MSENVRASCYATVVARGRTSRCVKVSSVVGDRVEKVMNILSSAPAPWKLLGLREHHLGLGIGRFDGRWSASRSELAGRDPVIVISLSPKQEIESDYVTS